MQAAVCAGIEVGGAAYYVYENEDGINVRRGGPTSAGKWLEGECRCPNDDEHKPHARQGKYVICSAATSVEDAIDQRTVQLRVLLVSCRS